MENRLTGVTGGNSASLSYDVLGRLNQTIGNGVTTRFGYDGADLIAEYDASGAITRRYIHGAGTDDPILWYEGAGTSDKRYLHKDERGSVTAITSGTGAVLAINSYDEYGIPAETNLGRFQYTGQTWLPEADLYYYKARIYSPTLGRFLQTDPIGYNDGMNWYNYVGSDPINKSDPTGLDACDDDPKDCIVVTGDKIPLTVTQLINNSIGGGGGGFGFPTSGQEALEGLFDAAVDKLKDMLPSDKEADKFLRCATEAGISHGLDLALDVAGVSAGLLTIKFRVAGAAVSGLVATAGITKGIVEDNGFTTIHAIIGKQAANGQGLIPNSPVTNALNRTNNLLSGASLANNSLAAINTFNKCHSGD